MKRKATNNLFKRLLNVVLSGLLGAFILFWIYRDFDFSMALQVFDHDTNWWWMLLSLFFGVLSHVFRGLRWKQMLDPLGRQPSKSVCIDSIFIAYAANLILPRVGEVSRCATLQRWERIPFSKSLGTIVTERTFDVLCMALITLAAFFLQMPVFLRFFKETGTKIPSFVHLVTSPWFYVSLFSVLAVAVLLYYFIRYLSFFQKVKKLFIDLLEGMLSVKEVRNVPLFFCYTAAIWGCYFLHFYLTFFCFPFTSQLDWMAGVVLFVAGTVAVIVPTPNGAGPWHFAIITMMVLYGISATDAGIFALIVHTIQTLLVVVLGVWGWIHLQLKKTPTVWQTDEK